MSQREREVLALVAQGHINDRVAEALSISPHTVKNHLTNILAALGSPSRAGAVAWAWRHGLATG